MGGGVPTALNKALLATGKKVITRRSEDARE